MITNANLHYTIIHYVIEHGYAPDVPTLATELEENEDNVIEALYTLQEYHGIVLHPHAPKIWVVHPFSLAPTNFLVKCGDKQWWGNCAWCSLGVAALLDGDITITTTFGAHGDSLDIEIINGQIRQDHLLVHFPVPMREAWDNVIYTCSTMLVFQDAEGINKWCQQHNIARGDIQPLAKVWELARRWYGHHHDRNWQKWTLAEAKEIFEDLGFTHDVWQLEPSQERL